MTLKTTDHGDETAERSVAVMSRAVRWGNDGVGLQFILPQESEARKELSPYLTGASKKEFTRFLQRLLKAKNPG